MLGIKKRLLEAILFLENAPVSTPKLAKYLGLNANECVLLVEQLTEEYDKRNSGLKILSIAGGYQMIPIEELKDQLVEIFSNRKKTRLSRTILETLSVIAWNQPCTRPEVEGVRGVDSTNPIKVLLEKGLIEETGRKEVIGRPILYSTTEEFLRYFNLQSLKDLPPLEEIKSAIFRPAKPGELTEEELEIEDKGELFKTKGINHDNENMETK